MKRKDARSLLEHWFRLGVGRCAPSIVLPSALPASPPRGQTIVLGAGKAAAAMAAIAASQIGWPITGCVVTRYGHGVSESTGGVEVIEAGHPVPDRSGADAAAKIFAIARPAERDDLVLHMISGGGSALLAAPIEGLSLNEKRQIAEFLVKSGAPIEEVNFIRKHLSRVKGGRLAVAADPAQQMTYVISDVVGDRPETVASGPSLSSPFDALYMLELLKSHGWRPSPALERAVNAAPVPVMASRPFKILATNKDALVAVEADAQGKGWRVINLGAHIKGEARVVGADHARLCRSLRSSNIPTIVLSGGELTVNVGESGGRGGPNLEYLAGLMLGVAGDDAVVGFAGDSDGIDGTEDNAGGYFDDTSLRRAGEVGLEPRSLLEKHDTYTLFSGLGDLVVTGPTRTNVNDIRIIMVNADEFHA
ncbi:MAG: DUF4147 domain-containing protein [Parvularculaceae bacterium]|nr:DUF4147 domain-containing protein [Parvularculaceae bacterium]